MTSELPSSLDTINHDNDEADASLGDESREIPKADTEAANYDPWATRSSTQRNSDTAVFMHLLKASIGSGILFLPHAFRKAGYATALICAFITGLISCHTAVITVQCTQNLCTRSRKSSLSFAETARVSFEHGPNCIRKYSTAFGVFVNVLVCFVQYQTSVVYTLYIATSSQQIIEYFTGINLDLRLYIALIFPILCALAMIPNFKYLVPVSVIGTVLMSLGIIGSLMYFIKDFPDVRRLEPFTDSKEIPMFSSIFLFAIYNMSIILPLENTMKNPRRMVNILTTSMIINIFIYAVFGFLGYNKYENSCDTVIKNLPVEERGAQIVKIMVTLSVVCTYGLQYYVPVTILWPIIARKIGRNHRSHEIIFRLLGVTLSSLLAVAVPQMTPLLGLFTALSITTVMLLIPVAIEASTMWNYTDNRKSFCCLLIKDIIIFIVWLLMLVFGVSQNLEEIIQTYGVDDENLFFCWDV
ncbi:proton-coupled amino acid transporter-like protein pathetic [Diachasmimorpha longicaudata]|uniref:proton-coupled amino acid transporter-like protein pathetic n=1 Tax=Diachasmimorpha longicaudata TaxID=58733 RepID=UPI0030B9085A